jgi:hypothetical protein
MPFPITPVNQKTGKPDHTAQKQTCWIERQFINPDDEGKFRMRKPADRFLINITDIEDKTEKRHNR